MRKAQETGGKSLVAILTFCRRPAYNERKDKADSHVRWRMRSAEYLKMASADLFERISVNPDVCAGKPCIKGTRIYIAIILDALAEGLSPENVIDHYPQLTIDDIHAALAYAAALAQENTWKLAG